MRDYSDMGRGQRYIKEKLSKADKSEIFRLSTIYHYRKIDLLDYQKYYRYRKMNKI